MPALWRSPPLTHFSNSLYSHCIHRIRLQDKSHFPLPPSSFLSSVMRSHLFIQLQWLSLMVDPGSKSLCHAFSKSCHPFYSLPHASLLSLDVINSRMTELPLLRLCLFGLNQVPGNSPPGYFFGHKLIIPIY